MQQIREYKILEKIGEGGMGEVFLAEDENLDRKVAIKSLAPELLRNHELIERFKQEARLQASLIHPNIVSLFTFLTEHNSMHMVLEYAPGITLKEEIKQHGSMDETRVLHVFKQILEGVGFAHQKGIIHRDLKPSNIMLDSNDNVKIMDFGIAKVLGDRGMTKTGTKMGTIYYMSPEQVRAEKDIDQRTDIYSLGIVLYEMLTGKLPFNTKTESDYEVMSEIVHGRIEDPRTIRQGISGEIISVMQKMIEKKKEDRYPTCYQCSINLTNGKSTTEEPKIEIPNQIIQQQGRGQQKQIVEISEQKIFANEVRADKQKSDKDNYTKQKFGKKFFVFTFTFILCIVLLNTLFLTNDKDKIETIVDARSIGETNWMKENLNVEYYRNGDPIPEIKNEDEWGRLETGAWCYYDNDPENGKKYGKLYNWYAVNDPRGLV